MIVAAGAWSGAIDGVPAGLTVRPVKGQILAFDNAPALVRHVMFREDVYLVPRLSGECLFGATVEDGVADRDVTLEGLGWLLEQAFETAPGLAGLRFLRAWAGLRPATEDGLPVVGPWPGAPGLLVATGHYRSGILFTPVTARLIRGATWWRGRCPARGDHPAGSPGRPVIGGHPPGRTLGFPGEGSHHAWPHAIDASRRSREPPRRPHRYRLRVRCPASILGVFHGGRVAYATARTKEQRDKLTPDDIIALMKKGNERFRLGQESPTTTSPSRRGAPRVSILPRLS